MKNDFYNETYVGNALNGLSQVGNWISGGRADISISARCGYFGDVKKDQRYWFIKEYIDWTFEPIEGKGHCLKAYKKDPNEEYDFDKGGIVGFGFMFLVAFAFCIPLSIIFWIYYLVKKLF